MSKFATHARGLLVAAALTGLAGAFGQAQDPPATAAPAQERPNIPGFGQREPEIRPYERVITKDAKSDPGVFTVHRIKEKVYYEIPKSELGKEFLWVTQIAKTTLGVGYGGQALGNRVVKWERRDNRVLLRNVSYQVVADPKEPIAQAVKAANNDAIIKAFFIEALGKDDAPVIDVTSAPPTPAWAACPTATPSAPAPPTAARPSTATCSSCSCWT